MGVRPRHIKPVSYREEVGRDRELSASIAKLGRDIDTSLGLGPSFSKTQILVQSPSLNYHKLLVAIANS